MKKLTALICAVAILCGAALTTGAAPTTTSTNTSSLRDADIFDALETLKHIVGMPNDAAFITGIPDPDIFDTLDILKGIVGINDPMMVNSVPPPLEPLSEELEARIVESLDQNRGISFHIQRYFGTYNGWVAISVCLYNCPEKRASDVCIIAGLTSSTPEEVAEYRFEHPSMNMAFLWNNEVGETISDAYEKGLITLQDVGDIWCHFYRILRLPPQYAHNFVGL